jgi:hypothetical protein
VANTTGLNANADLIGGRLSHRALSEVEYPGARNFNSVVFHAHNFQPWLLQNLPPRAFAKYSPNIAIFMIQKCRKKAVRLDCVPARDSRE